MKETFTTVFSWVIIGCISAAGFAVGYLVAENEELRARNKIAVNLMEIQNALLNAKTKEATNETEKKTEE